MRWLLVGSLIMILVVFVNLGIYGISKLLHKINYKMTISGYYLLSTVVLMLIGVVTGWYVINILG